MYILLVMVFTLVGGLMPGGNLLVYSWRLVVSKLML